MENHLWLVFVVLGVLALMQLASIARSLQSTEAMMMRLLSHQGVEWGKVVEPSERVKELARMPGQRVAAIKAYREQTGLGVKEAMAVVDRISNPMQSAA